MKPAFPTAMNQTEGMSLRDYLASHLLDEPSGEDYHAIVKEALVGRRRPKGDEDGWLAVIQFEAEFRAAWRYMRADAMLEAREEVKQLKEKEG